MPITPDQYDRLQINAIPYRLARVRRTYTLGRDGIVSINSDDAIGFGSIEDACASHSITRNQLRLACEEGRIFDDRVWLNGADWIDTAITSNIAERQRAIIIRRLLGMERTVHYHPSQSYLICRFDSNCGLVVFRLQELEFQHSTIDAANHGHTFEGYRFCWWEDWNAAISSIPNAPDDVPGIVSSVPNDIGGLVFATDSLVRDQIIGPLAARLAAIVPTPRRPGNGGCCVVVINAEYATEYSNCGSAARAFHLQTQTVRNRCNRSDLVRDPRFVWATDWRRTEGVGGEAPAPSPITDAPDANGIYINQRGRFVWATDWRRTEGVGGEAPAPSPITDAPDANGIYINQRELVFSNDRSIGMISRCGLGHYARIETAQGTVDFFHLQLPAIHAWIRSSALVASPRIHADNEEAGPQPASIRQPNGGRAEFDHRGRLRTRATQTTEHTQDNSDF